MGASYNIKCKHCGTEFIHIADDDFGVIRACVGCEYSADMNAPIFCPGCMTRLNKNEEDFQNQITAVMTW